MASDASSQYVLCTGGLGYIGTHTVVKLLEQGHRVAIMDSCANASPVVLKRVEQVFISLRGFS